VDVAKAPGHGYRRPFAGYTVGPCETLVPNP
jgi:hypothetical protein